MKVAETFELNKNLIQRSSVEKMNFIAMRPKNMSLSNKKAKQLLNTKIISLSNSLKEIKRTISRI